MKSRAKFRWPLVLMIIASFALVGVSVEAKKKKKKKKDDPISDVKKKAKDAAKAADKAADKAKGKKQEKEKDKEKDKGQSADKGKTDDKGKDQGKDQGLALGKDKEKGEGLALGKDKEPGEGLALGKDKDEGEEEELPAMAPPVPSPQALTLIASLPTRGPLAKEQAKHLKRLAKIERLQALAATSGNAALVQKATMLHEKEMNRHTKKMAKMRGAPAGGVQ